MLALRSPQIHISRTGEIIQKAPPSRATASARRPTKPAGVGEAGAAAMAGDLAHDSLLGDGSRKRVSTKPKKLSADVLGTFAPPSLTQQRSKRPRTVPAPSRSSLGGGSSKSNAQAMKPCTKLIKELASHPLAWPFAKPVDIQLFPDYYTVIVDPIDLGTIRKRLDAGDYESRDEFADDVRRVWENCFKYNPAGTDVCNFAKQLQAFFEQKLASLPSESDMVANAQMKEMEKQMQAMQKQMLAQQQLLMQQQQMQMMGGGLPGMGGMPMMPTPAPPSTKTKKAAPKSKGGGRNSLPAPQLPPFGAFAATAVPVDETREMTFEEKSALSADINRLDSNNLGRVVTIIRTNQPSLGNDGGDLEVDLHSLDAVTLWKLRAFLDSCKSGSKKKKSKKAPAVSAQSRMQASERALACADHNIAALEAAERTLDASGAAESGIVLQGNSGGGALLDVSDLDDSDSDEAVGSLVPGASAGGGARQGGSALWEGLSNSKQQRDAEREAQERKKFDASRAEVEKARERERQRANAIERQRAAERARLNDDEGALDLLGQGNDMGEFEVDGHDQLSENFNF